MKNLELLKKLISNAEELTYDNVNNVDSYIRRAYMVCENIFGEESRYCQLIYKIDFYPTRDRFEYDDEFYQDFWAKGKQELIDLLKIAVEEYEFFIMPKLSIFEQVNTELTVDSTQNSPQQDLLYTIIKSLSEQKSSLDKNIAILLNYADLSIVKSTQSSDRYNCVWATVVIKLPHNLKSKFTEEMSKRLLQVLVEFTPSDLGIDISEVSVEVKIEKAYGNWRDDVLKALIGEGVNNQALFKSSSHPMVEYKGIRFRSKSEMALAPVLETSNVLFFPLPLAVCGNERKEPDFLVCKNGKWAILEVVADLTHPSVVKEADRTNWFLNHHIHLRQYSSLRCFKEPQVVIADFLKWLDGLK